MSDPATEKQLSDIKKLCREIISKEIESFGLNKEEAELILGEEREHFKKRVSDAITFPLVAMTNVIETSVEGEENIGLDCLSMG